MGSAATEFQPSLAGTSGTFQAQSPPQKPVTARVVWVVGLSDDSAQHVFQPSTGVSVERGQPDE